jgi:phage protein U
MLAMIGDTVFEINKTSFQKFSEEFEYTYNDHNKVRNFTHQTPIGQYKQSFSLSGRLILRPNNSLESIENDAKLKVPMVLAFLSGKCYWVIVKKISKQKERFLNTGEHLVEDFTIELERYFYDPI